ncbi:MFS transporter [Micromonospora sp. NPDC050417]|uniref:MFS transporter n=1 Tax=Micromonospora sp. NPDC050417 TaxID=3364280 RepID=UPI0037B2848F
MNRFVEIAAPSRFGTGFRWLLASSWATNLGDGIALAAGPLLVASLTTDAFLVSLAALLRWAPPLLFGLYAGVLSDRFDRRRIIIVANVVRTVVLGALVVMLATDRASVAGALLALGLLATTEVFADNTTSTLLPMLVHRDDLAIANSRLQTGFITLNQLCGPAIGATLFAAGSAWPFVTEAVLVGWGVALVWQIKLPAHGRDLATMGSVGRDILQGLRWTLGHPAVRTLALTILIFNVTFGAAWSVLVLYATERLGLGAVGFGIPSTVTAVGGLAGTALYGWITRRVSLGNVMRVGLVIETLTHLALALTTSAWVASAILFVFGAHAFIWSTTSVTVRQRAVPTEFQGRVGSVNMTCVFGGLVVGSTVGGLLAARIDVTAPFWFAFIGSAIFVVALWRNLTLIAHADEESVPDARQVDPALA